MRLAMNAAGVGFAVSICACTIGEPRLGETASASTVADEVDSGCSTTVVLGLSRQIAEEAGCENPDSFASFDQGGGITFTSDAVLPYLVKQARDDLQAVAVDTPLQINSALRTLAQQYLLYHWYLDGTCGIADAAQIGTSNHEGGRAVDLDNFADVIAAMGDHGWAHDVAGDDVHFDHTSSPDDRGQDVLAFQVLWNRNHPEDVIDEDGAYGSQTDARLQEAPATGFPIGADCQPDPGKPSLPVHSGDSNIAIAPDDVSSSSTSGCDAGVGADALGALPVLALVRRRHRRSER